MDIVKTWLELQAQANKAQEPVLSKMDEVLKLIYTTFGSRLSNWYVSGAEEGSIGDLYKALSDEYVSGLEIDAYRSKDMIIIDKDNKEIDLTYGFPVRWIIEKIEDVKKELEEGKVLYEEKERKRKLNTEAQRLNRKTKKLEIKAQALKKLTKEERKALGVR